MSVVYLLSIQTYFCLNSSREEVNEILLCSCATAKAEHELSNLFCVLLYVELRPPGDPCDWNPAFWLADKLSLKGGIDIRNFLILNTDLESASKFPLELYGCVIFKSFIWKIIRKFKNWPPPFGEGYSANQNAGFQSHDNKNSMLAILILSCHTMLISILVSWLLLLHEESTANPY